jgi:chloramphenicol 3-O-phosphotransferase
MSAYSASVTGEDSDLPQRRILIAALDLVRRELPVSELFAPGVDVERVISLLGPSARADAVIEWVAVNGERVDAVVTAGESQWRIVFGRSSEQTINWLDVYERPTRCDDVSGGRAILMNGPSGAGKSTLMRAVQQIASAPLVIFDEPEHVGAVQPEYLIWRDRAPALHRGYLEAIAALAGAGTDVALSAAGRRQAEFVHAFGDVPIHTVGLRCDLAVLVERERRSGRWGGIAAESLGVHEGWTYDIEFDTTQSPDPLDLARQILNDLGSRASGASRGDSRRRDV